MIFANNRIHIEYSLVDHIYKQIGYFLTGHVYKQIKLVRLINLPCSNQ